MTHLANIELQHKAAHGTAEPLCHSSNRHLQSCHFIYHFIMRVCAYVCKIRLSVSLGVVVEL